VYKNKKLLNQKFNFAKIKPFTIKISKREKVDWKEVKASFFPFSSLTSERKI